MNYKDEVLIDQQVMRESDHSTILKLLLNCPECNLLQQGFCIRFKGSTTYPKYCTYCGAKLEKEENKK